MTDGSQRQRDILICLCLALVTAAVYWPAHHYDFINCDDDKYITDDPHLRDGLTLRGLSWAFTTGLDQWMPVTWLARILEYQLFGLNAASHHLINVVFHIANTLLLFGILKRMTSATWRSALVAALFALHPLHVEAVAWVTGLKDVLSMCLGLLTIWAYGRYVEHLNVQRSTSNVERSTPLAPLSAAASAKEEAPTTAGRSLVRRSLGEGGKLHGSYGLTLLLFALAVMAKPMMVTLPLVLLLLDYWPLGRTRWAEPALTRSGPATGESVKVPASRLFKEKLPFFVLAAGSCALTFWARHNYGAIISLEQVPLSGRTAHAVISYVSYLRQTIWPSGLALCYPYGKWSWEVVVEAGVVLVVLSTWVVRRARRIPQFLVGWLWFLGTLVPVIGLVQVGSVSRADRYTYLPLVGLFIMVAWSVPPGAIKGRIGKAITCVATGAVLAVYAVLSRVQAGYWKNSETLFRHTLSVTRDNGLAHAYLGMALLRLGQLPEAVGHLEQAVRIQPGFAEAHNNLAVALARLGRLPEATRHAEQALQLKPGLAEAHYNLGVALEQKGKRQEALGHYEEAVRIRPDYAQAHNNLAVVLAQLGRLPEAIGHAEQALRLKPDMAEAHYNLGLALEQMGKLPDAVVHYEQALRLKPDFADAHSNLGVALVRLGRTPEAIGHFEQVLRLKPDFVSAHYNLGGALVRLGRVPEAIRHYEEALRIKPDYAEAHNDFANVLLQAGKVRDAIEHYEQALRLKPGYAEAQNNLAWLLATLPPADGGEPARAVTLAQRACELTGNRSAAYLDTLAAAYAAAGRFDAAVATAQKAIELARSAGQPQVVKEIEDHLQLFHEGRAYRRPVKATDNRP